MIETTDNDRLLRPKEAAQFLGLSLSGFYLLMSRSEIAWTMIGRARRIRRGELVDLIARNGSRPAEWCMRDSGGLPVSAVNDG